MSDTPHPSDLPQGPDGSDSNDDLSLDQQLQLYRKALEQEYGLSENATPDDLDKIRSATQQKLLRAVPEAVERIIALMTYAEKDTTQLSAAKFIIANGLGGTGEGDDPLSNLIKQLTSGEEVKK